MLRFYTVVKKEKRIGDTTFCLQFSYNSFRFDVVNRIETRTIKTPLCARSVAATSVRNFRVRLTKLPLL